MDVTQHFNELKRLIHEKSGEIESLSRSGGAGSEYQQKIAEEEKYRLENELRDLVGQHPELEAPVSFVPSTAPPLTQSRPRKTVQMSRKKTVTTVTTVPEVVVNTVPEVAVATVPEVALPCDILYDPCTRKPLEENTIKALEKRIREIRNMSSENPEVEQFPDTIKTRLDLLIDLLNKPEAPSNKLFKYTINGQLYEAYWDIVFTLNLIDEFQRTDDFYMITKKAELLRPDELEAYVNNPIEYLKNRNVNEGASGASDITFCYKNPKEIIAEDACSAPPLSSEGCAVGLERASVDTRTKFYFCSSKFYKKDFTKSAESFDIQKIYTAVKKLHQDFDVRIILLVKDKTAVDTKLQNARNKYISEEASRVYGERDLFAALLKIYNLARQKIKGTVTEDSLKNVLGITDKIKPILSPRLHQHMAIIKIQHAINNFKITGGNNKFLVGILPRGGKTYIAGGIVSVLQPKRVVVLLGAKSETISQFTNDLFKFYQDFSDYEVVDVVEGSSEIEIDPSKKYIFVMSVELYKMQSTRKILQELKGGENKADLFICDEAHLKQTTDKAIKELEEGTGALKSAEEEDAEEKSGLAQLDEKIARDVPVVYMTGTYIKPLTVFKIPDEHVAIWEYQDIQEGKNIIDNEQYFKDNFPGIYEEALAKCFSYGETYDTIQSMYRRFPNLYLLSTQFTDDAKAAFLKQSQGGEKVGFPTVTHLFQVKKDYSPDKPEFPPSLWHTGFTNPVGMTRLINYLSPSAEVVVPGQEVVSPIQSVMKRIDRISQRIGDRLAFFTSQFVVHSQLWFLPAMQGHPLIKRMSALAGVIFQSSWYRKNFNVLAVSSSADWSNIPGARDRSVKIGEGTFSWACPSGRETLKACILREEASARAQGKGLVILAQNMLHLGISLTCVDIVVLLDAGEKVDERIQKMYRALTESTNKKGGFIVDLNYFRTVTAIMNYQIQASKTRHKKEVYADSGLKEAFNSIIETYSIDDDLNIYGTKEEGSVSRIESETIPELQRMLKEKPKGRTDGMTITEVGQAMNKDIETALKDAYGRDLDFILGELADNSVKHTMREHGEGVQAAEEEDNNDNEPRAKKAPKLFPDEVEKNPVEKRKAFMDIFKTAMKIGVFGTEYKTLPKLVEAIETDSNLREIIYDTLVKRGTIQDGSDSEFIMRLILRELKDIIEQKKNSSYSGMKEAFNSKETGNKFQEVLEYINTHLTPKETERAKHGEVFTPLNIVDQMLSRLPQRGTKNVWNKKDYKWLDPANGIGNFPIKAFIGQNEGKYTYPGLFEGLKKEFPNDKERCKWIIENMLYMVDINGKNNLIAKRLIEKLCPGATANIEQIDKKNGFLTEKPLEFNGKEIMHFDIILGNPPFNSGGLKSSGDEDAKTIWPKFVEKSYSLLKNGGLLLFLHPPQWRVGKLPLYTKIKELLLSNQIMYLKSYEKDKSTGNDVTKFEETDVRFEYYLLKKARPSEETILNDIYGNETSININDLPYIPNAGYNILKELYKKQKELGKLQFVDGPTKIKKASGNVRKITNMSNTNGIDYIVENNKYIDQERCKVCTNGETARWPICFVDKGGKTEDEQYISQRYILCNNVTEANKVANFLSSKVIQFLIFSSHFQIQARTPDILYRSLPDISSIEIDFTDDKEIYKFLKLTNDDIKIVEIMNRLRVLTDSDLHTSRKTPKTEKKGGSRTIHRFTRRKRN